MISLTEAVQLEKKTSYVFLEKVFWFLKVVLGFSGLKKLDFSVQIRPDTKF